MKAILFILCLTLLPGLLCSDEGMWPLNQLPKNKIYKKYGVQLDEKWIHHVQQSCLRVSVGGSASFVSPQGLVMTNHHIASQAIYHLSTDEKNLMEKGFYAENLSQELKCPSLYMDQLVSIRDVTDIINSEVTDQMSREEREKYRLAIMAKIKENTQAETGLQPEIVTLYQGARYHLYLYKRYVDIRLVMAPEKAIASFGGDIENFEYPRHVLDMAFFRVYENGNPLHSPHHFQWSAYGPKEGEPLFIIGHPGKTDRQYTSDHLIFNRDYAFPLILEFIQGKIQCFDQFAERGINEKRVAAQDKSRYTNALKVYAALIKGLNESPILSSKIKQEKAFLSSLSNEEQSSWNEIKKELDALKSFYLQHFYLEGRGSHFSKMFVWARDLFRLAEEKEKPNEERLKEYLDSEIPKLELSLLSNEPVYIEYETELLKDSITRLVEKLGKDHPAVEVILEGKTIQERVEKIISGTSLHDPQFRQKLFHNVALIKHSNDSLIFLAKALDPFSRELREKMEKGFLATQKENYAKIIRLYFDRFGKSISPDATFTLRLTVGTMVGYYENGQWIPPMTTIGETYTKGLKNHYQYPYDLPPSWHLKRKIIDPQTPFNFVSTHDIIGGNSGSPVINAQGEVVGLTFDGNIHAFTWNFKFDQHQGRAISVHSAAILHTLQHIYQANRLVQELENLRD